MLFRSEDNRCRIFFDKDALYRSAWGRCWLIRCRSPEWVRLRDTGWNTTTSLEKSGGNFHGYGRGCRGNGQDSGLFLRRGRCPAFRGDQKLGNWVGADVRSLGFFALLRDTIPPSLNGIKPVNGAGVATHRPMISALFGDDLSGIHGEDQYRFLLDGSRLVVEYDPGTAADSTDPGNPERRAPRTRIHHPGQGGKRSQEEKRVFRENRP